MTYSEIIAIEPRIAAVIESACSVGSIRIRYQQYGALKNQLRSLVGWYAADERLLGSSAYDIVLRELLRKLKL